MGTGIAIVGNKMANLKVKVVDSTEKSLAKSRKVTEDWCTKEVDKKRMTSEDRYKIL